MIEPRVHLVPDPAFRGHFNVLRGYIAPLGLAGVKIVGDFHDNYKHDLPSELALLNLFDPKTGAPIAVTAPVRISVIAVASMRATGIPVRGSKRLRSAISEGRPRL